MKRISQYVALAALGAAAAALPASPARAADQDKVQYKEVARDDMPREVRHAADDQTRGARDLKYQRQLRDGKTFYSVHFTNPDGKRMEVRLDERGKVVDGPHAARDQSSGTASKDRSDSDANDDAGVKWHHISDRDVSREVPKDVLRTMDQYTKDGRDLFYQSQIRDGKTFYSVHYTGKDSKRMFVRVDDKGKLALGPKESDAKERNAANPDVGKQPRAENRPEATVKREAITADDLPAPVRKTVEQTMADGGGHNFIRETKGNEVTYVVEYTKNGQRTSARVGADGKVIQGSPVASTPAAPAPTPAPSPNVAKAEADAQLAAAREAAATAPFQVLSGADQLPAEVRRAADKELTDATDPLIQRFTRGGQTLYSIHYTGPNGGRRFMAVDSTGKIIAQPKKSAWQEGGKNVKFAVIDGGKLPAEVRKQVEAQGGSEHLFLTRTGPGGQTSYLIQYTDKDGERMETEIAANGKLTEKPRKAHEQPFTLLERKEDKR